MLSNREVNERLKKFNSLSYGELEEFYEEMKEYHYYAKNKKNKDIAQKILIDIYKKAQTFEEFKTDPHLNPEMRTVKAKVKRAKNKDREKHDWDIEYETTEQTFSEFNGEIVVYVVENKINGKAYIGYVKSDYGVQKIFNSLSSKSNAKYNKDLAEDWKQYGERNFKMIVKKVCHIGEEEAIEYKKELVEEYIDSGVELYNKHY